MSLKAEDQERHNEDLKLAGRQLACVIRLALGAGVTAEEVDAALAKLTPGCPSYPCPKCGALVEDPDDGFGVLIHDECGYCSHPDAYGGVCRACGATVDA